MTTPKLASLALCAAIAAAAPPAMAQAAAAKPAAPAACFYGRNVNNFVAVDNETINIRVGVRQAYQLKLFAPCIGVTWSQSIALVSRPGGFICAGSANVVDVLIHTSVGRQRCPVTSIRPLSADQIAAMPKKQRP